jgi:TonB family protein
MKVLRLLGALLLIVCMSAAAGSQPTMDQLKSWAVYTPRPSIVSLDTTQFIAGPGVFLLRFDSKSGMVIRVEVLKSTMFGEVDRDCVKVFEKWKFKPGVLPKDFELKIPLDSIKLRTSVIRSY